GELDVLQSDRLAAALDLDRDDVSFVLAAELVQELGLIANRLAVDLDDHVARLEAGFLRCRFRSDGSHGRRGMFAPLQSDPQQSAAQVASFLETREGVVDVLERNREANAGIVPL